MTLARAPEHPNPYQYLNTTKTILTLSTKTDITSKYTTSLKIVQYLTHYWPISYSTIEDIVGNADMQQGMNTIFTSDRFGCPNSALNLNGGYTYVQAGIYFDAPEFTISVWIYPRSVGSGSRVIDFGNTPAPLDNIVLSLNSNSNDFPSIYIRNGTEKLNIATSSSSLANRWQFLAATFDGNIMRIYIDGLLKGNASVTYSLPTLIRTNNYIGKNGNSNSFSSSYLDDLRFYNKSLTQSEIYQLLNLNSKHLFHFIFDFIVCNNRKYYYLKFKLLC